MDLAEGSTPKKPTDDPSVVLFLGLYLILLAFFILLTAISTIEESKSEAAVSSVNGKFGDKGADTLTGLSIIAELGSGTENTGFRGDVEAAFHSSLPADGFEADDLGGVLRILVPIVFIFGEDAASVEPDRVALFDAVATALSYTSPGISNEVEIVVNTGDQLPPPTGDLANVSVRRAGALARALNDHGVAARRISAGVRSGRESTVAFLFQRRPEGESGISFQSLGL